MNTRYSRPLHCGDGVFASAWILLPAVLLAVGVAVVALLGMPAASPTPPEAATGLPGLPPAA